MAACAPDRDPRRSRASAERSHKHPSEMGASPRLVILAMSLSLWTLIALALRTAGL
ncbi:MAG: hypothetical protein KDE35_09430 [Geminicoccaceae bacterium]|nr:hypothetical protein [Geminicoccaceae bacterium]